MIGSILQNWLLLMEEILQTNKNIWEIAGASPYWTVSPVCWVCEGPGDNVELSWDSNISYISQ